MMLPREWAGPLVGSSIYSGLSTSPWLPRGKKKKKKKKKYIYIYIYTYIYSVCVCVCVYVCVL